MSAAVPSAVSSVCVCAADVAGVGDFCGTKMPASLARGADPSTSIHSGGACVGGIVIGGVVRRMNVGVVCVAVAPPAVPTATTGEGGRPGSRRRMRSASWCHRLRMAKRRCCQTTQEKRRRRKRHSPWRLR